MKIGVESYYTVVVFSADEIITGIFCPVLGSMVQEYCWRSSEKSHKRDLGTVNHASG